MFCDVYRLLKNPSLWAAGEASEDSKPGPPSLGFSTTSSSGITISQENMLQMARKIVDSLQDLNLEFEPIQNRVANYANYLNKFAGLLLQKKAIHSLGTEYGLYPSLCMLQEQICNTFEVHNAPLLSPCYTPVLMPLSNSPVAVDVAELQGQMMWLQSEVTEISGDLSLRQLLWQSLLDCTETFAKALTTLFYDINVEILSRQTHIYGDNAYRLVKGKQIFHFPDRINFQFL